MMELPQHAAAVPSQLIAENVRVAKRANEQSRHSCHMWVASGEKNCDNFFYRSAAACGRLIKASKICLKKAKNG